MSVATQEGSAAALASGKGHTDENFPVASVLIAPRHRAPVMAFYRFARTADDVADDPHASAECKLDLLERMRATLVGESDAEASALALRRIQEKRNLSPQHALDLLEAFRRDVTKLRYTDWADLMDYCRYSASPVGRFVLDVHGEGRASWPANDALCTALQVINHLQDCGKDYRDLDRVYVPQDELASAGVAVDALGASSASPALKRVIADLARRTSSLLDQARPFAGLIRDPRLALEVSVIHRVADSLDHILMRRDPLSERVHHTKAEMAGLAISTVAAFPLRRLGARRLRGRAARVAA